MNITLNFRLFIVIEQKCKVKIYLETLLSNITFFKVFLLQKRCLSTSLTLPPKVIKSLAFYENYYVDIQFILTVA